MSGREITQTTVDKFWTLLVGDIRKWKPDVTDKDKMLMAGAVFILARAVLIQHYKSRFSDTMRDMIDSTLERELNIPDANEHQRFLIKITECSPSLSEWIKEYVDTSTCLSDQIEKTITVNNNDINSDENINIDVDGLREHFNAAFNGKIKNHDDKMPYLLEIIRKESTDVAIGQIALQIHSSKYFIKDNKYKTFKPWYNDFCQLIGRKPNLSYTKRNFKIKDDQLLRSFSFLKM